MQGKIIAAMFAASLAGCATHPDQIKAVKSSAECTPADRQRLAELSEVQAATSRNDAVGVFLIGVPMGSVAGKDHEEEIARLKGACGDAPSPDTNSN